MKVTREFTPMTITVETPGDLQNLAQMLRNSYQNLTRWRGMTSSRDTAQEKFIKAFANELGINL